MFFQKGIAISNNLDGIRYKLFAVFKGDEVFLGRFRSPEIAKRYVRNWWKTKFPMVFVGKFRIERVHDDVKS